MNEINFFQEDVTLIIEHKSVLTQWIVNIISTNGHEIESINFIYCSDKYLLEVNKTYLDHDYYTDIITFDNRDFEGLPIDSDIFISIDRVKENASDLNITFQEELHRVMIHGVLHLLGYEDSTDLQKKEMREKEEASLSLLHI